MERTNPSISILLSPHWKDYELLDSGNQKRLEQFGDYLIARPDPQAIWRPSLDKNAWNNAHATFIRDNENRERWDTTINFPPRWRVRYKKLSFWARLTPFKHTGIFPEQAAHWEWMENKIKNQKSEGKDMKILNLFAYTGIASLVCAAAGAHVTHVDASKPAITWAHDNQELSNLSNKPIRWILDDAIKFVRREIKRGKKYDGIIMDPPIYGHGPNGERWDFAEHFPILLSLCRSLLSDTPLFVIANAYAISSSPLMLQTMFHQELTEMHGTIDVGELVLQEKSGSRFLSTGIYGRWSAT